MKYGNYEGCELEFSRFPSGAIKGELFSSEGRLLYCFTKEDVPEKMDSEYVMAVKGTKTAFDIIKMMMSKGVLEGTLYRGRECFAALTEDIVSRMAGDLITGEVLIDG